MRFQTTLEGADLIDLIAV